jgi:hypothetical protein
MDTRLRRFDHLTRFDALGANQHLFDLTLVKSPNALQIGVETPFGDVMGMADVATHHGFLAAYRTHF